ncbi:MAG: hypothetical protein R3E01_22350 [Pirellulaceae bacterium]
MRTASPVPRRPSTGVTTGTPEVYSQISDSRWYASGFGGGFDSCCGGTDASTCPASGGPSGAPSGEPGAGGSDQFGTVPGTFERPRIEAVQINEYESYGLEQADDFVNAASDGGMGGTVDSSRGNLIQQYSAPGWGAVGPGGRA